VPRGTQDLDRSHRPFRYRTFTFCGRPFQCRSHKAMVFYSLGLCGNPRRVLLLPRRNAHTLTRLESRLLPFRSPLLRELFLFLRVLRCFSSPRAPRHAYVFSMRYPGIPLGGFPHSDIPGSSLVGSSPRLLAAYYVLLRPLTPRHPPCALSNLIVPSFAGRTFCSVFKVLALEDQEFASVDLRARAPPPFSRCPTGRPTRPPLDHLWR
jgi:hypothetical protein